MQWLIIYFAKQYWH